MIQKLVLVFSLFMSCIPGHVRYKHKGTRGSKSTWTRTTGHGIGRGGHCWTPLVTSGDLIAPYRKTHSQSVKPFMQLLLLPPEYCGTLLRMHSQYIYTSKIRDALCFTGLQEVLSYQSISVSQWMLSSVSGQDGPNPGKIHCIWSHS